MPKPPLGDYLGDFKDELLPDDYIVEFATGGPKNYRYKTHKGEDCKVQGIIGQVVMVMMMMMS